MAKRDLTDQIYLRRRKIEEMDFKDRHEALKAISALNMPIKQQLWADCESAGGHQVERAHEDRAFGIAIVEICWRCHHRKTVHFESDGDE